MKIKGKATLEGTSRYKERYKEKCHSEHFQEANGSIVSSIGIGTYLGESNVQTNTLVTEAIIESVCSGVNLIDSAISYRDQQGERSVGKAVHHLIDSKKVSRDELIICSKAGILAENTNKYLNWFYENYIQNSSSEISEVDLVEYHNNNYYCIHPEYLRDQVNWSLDNLGLETIDVYYIHNPERQLLKISSDALYDRLQAAFEVMEDEVSKGKIGAYGLATWDGLRVPLDSPQHLNLERIKLIAQKAARNKQDSLQFIQFPLNLAMPEALLAPTQKIGSEQIPLLEACYRLEIYPISSASIYRGQVIGKIPETIAATFGKDFQTDCQRALQYTRSTPGLLSALVGMKSINHVEENLSITNCSLMEKEQFKKLTYSIVEVLSSMNMNSNNLIFDLSNLYSNSK